MTPAFLEPLTWLSAVLAAGGPLWGKAALAGVFLLVLIWLLVLPPHLLGQTPDVRIPWWRHVRFWASVVAIVQIAVYLWWG